MVKKVLVLTFKCEAILNILRENNDNQNTFSILKFIQVHLMFTQRFLNNNNKSFV